MVNDVRRAHLHAKIERDVFIKLPEEDPDFGGEKIGKQALPVWHSRRRQGLAGYT